MAENKFNLTQTGQQVQSILNSSKNTDQVLTEIQEAMADLPDGQAVSAQVALNTAAIEELSEKVGQGDGAYDISEANAVGGVLATYADLAAALGENGSNIPADLRKGGMSVKFVQSSDNKYVHYNLLADSFTTDTTQWAIAEEGVPVENPEFVYVKTDRDDKILWAIKIDGGIYYGAGCPQQIIDYINEKIAELSLDEYEDIVAFLNGLEEGDKTLQELLDNKLDAVPVENPEYIRAVTDSEDKIIEAITTEGRKQVNVPVDTPSVSIDSVEDSEWIQATTDREGKVLEGRKSDGTHKECVSFESPQIITDVTTSKVYNVKERINLSDSAKNNLKEDLGITNIPTESIIETNSLQDLQSLHSIQHLKDELKSAYEMIDSLKSTKNGSTQDRVTVELTDSHKKKLILNLHKRIDTGTAQTNDIFLPNAKDDFSDIRVITNTGKILPYKVINKGDYDIIPTSIFGTSQSRPYQNSRGSLIFASSKTSTYPGISNDNGVTWQILDDIKDGLDGCYICFVSADDTLFVSKSGHLYRCPYPYTSKEEVLDINIDGDNVYTGCYIMCTSICQHPDGELFLGSYQTENAIRIYKSTDDGRTWVKVHHSTDYQHVHCIICDTNQSPAVIYAGCDTYNGLYYSKDKGTTWFDLNADRTLPYSIDYGVIYPGVGFRLLGGETQYKGGHSIIRTTDDEIFTPVLSCGQGSYMIKNLGDTLFAGLLSSHAYLGTQIVVSKDHGLTWNTAYSTMGVTYSGGASDGFRLMQKLINTSTNEEYIWVGVQNALDLVQNALTIFANNSHFAEIIVEIPEGVSTIRVESGYLISDNKEVYNDTEINNKLLELIPLNDNLIYDSVRKQYYNGNFKMQGRIKKLGNFVNPIISGEYSLSLLSADLPLKDIPLDISQYNAVTISFWLRSEGHCAFEVIDGIKYEDGGLMFNDNFLFSSGLATLLVGKKMDIILDFTNNKIGAYYNGGYYREKTVDFADYRSKTNWKIIRPYGLDGDTIISEFTIRQGIVSLTESKNEYFSLIDDNTNK